MQNCIICNSVFPDVIKFCTSCGYNHKEEIFDKETLNGYFNKLNDWKEEVKLKKEFLKLKNKKIVNGQQGKLLNC